jgi:hypothetical protein
MSSSSLPNRLEEQGLEPPQIQENFDAAMSIVNGKLGPQNFDPNYPPMIMRAEPNVGDAPLWDGTVWTPAVLSGDNLRQSAWTQYTATLIGHPTEPSLGANGYSVGWWTRQADRFIVGRFAIQFAGAGIAAGSGIYEISLPFAMTYVSGQGIGYDDSTAGSYPHLIRHYNANTVVLMTLDTVPAATYGSAAPIAWAANDYICLGTWYGEAPS